MNESTNLFNVRTWESLDINGVNPAPGDIYVFGDSVSLATVVPDAQSYIDQLNADFTLNEYSVHSVDSKADNNEDFNIVCVVPDSLSGQNLFVVALSSPEDFKYAVAEVVNVAETLTRKYLIEAIICLALLSPHTYHSEFDIRHSSLRCSSVSYSKRNEDWISFDIDSNSGITGADEDDYCILPPVCALSAPDENYETESFSSLRNEEDAYKKKLITSRMKDEIISNLPDKISELYKKQHPEMAEAIHESLLNFTQQEFKAILLAFAKKKAGFLRDITEIALSSSVKYEFYLKKWSSECKKDFKDRYLYCLYLKDANNVERPVIFKNTASYCIYVMYLLDRAQRKDEACELPMKQLKKQFSSLYSTLIMESPSVIEKQCEELDRRKVKGTNRERKGRYDDYIKDIHETLEKMVGELNSIPLKVGHGRFLEVNPESIHIDRKMPKFDFAKH